MERILISETVPEIEIIGPTIVDEVEEDDWDDDYYCPYCEEEEEFDEDDYITDEDLIEEL